MIEEDRCDGREWMRGGMKDVMDTDGGADGCGADVIR